MNKILRFFLVALMAIVFGNVYADEVTMKYTGTENANITGENSATLVGLDASAWSVVGDKGKQTSFPGLIYNANGNQIRLYWNAEGSNTITVSSLAGATINSIKITFATGNEGYKNISVTVGGNAVSGTDGAYDINSTSFVLGNANTSSMQVRFTELVINYTPAGGGGSEGGGSVETLDITSVLEQTYVEEAEKYKYTKFAEGKITSVANTSPNNKGVGTEESPLPKETDDATAFSQAVPVELTDYLLKVSTTSVEMSLVSTPNANDNTAANAWAISDQTDGNNALSTDACNPKFNVYVSPKGNPTATYFGYWVYNNDGAPSFKCPNEYQTFWTPEVGAAPSKGAFTSIKISQAGSLKIGVRIPKAGKNRKVYFVKQSDGTILAQDQYNAEGYDNNNGNEYTVHTTTDYVVATDVNNQFIGYINVTLPVNETYVMFSPDTQIGIYGFQFTPGGSTNIETVKNKVWNPNAPMYNLSGQKVDKSYKGIVIQNGRKFVNK